MPPASQTFVLPDLYLPTGPLPLLAALASVLGTGYPAEIVYLEDATPLPDGFTARIEREFPGIVLKRSFDSAAIEEFATLPCWFPAILRRNVAFRSCGRLVRPQDRPGSWMEPGYRNAYVYLTGNFTAKTLRSRCKTIILREEGLGSYYGLRHGWGKALLRRMAGLPRHQIMGEEPWVDRIEITRPQALPPNLRMKARALSLADLIKALPDGMAQCLAKAFWSGPLPPLQGRRALLLTQPVDLAGLGNKQDKKDIYAAIIAELKASGYRVLVKPHPRESVDPRTHTLPSFFPIEAWSWLGMEPFDLAVALCSSALEGDTAGFSRCNLQLVTPERFQQGDFGGWQNRLQATLKDTQLAFQMS